MQSLSIGQEPSQQRIAFSSLALILAVLYASCCSATAAHVKVAPRLTKAERILQERHLHQPKQPATPVSECEQAFWVDKLVVASRYVDDVSWMAAYLVGIVPFVVYATWDDPDAAHTTVSNHGREASAYLQFIVDYYDCLPETVAFIHSHRASPHSPDMLLDLRRLKWDSVPGFVSLSRTGHISSLYLKEPNKHLWMDANDTSPTAFWSRYAYNNSLNFAAAWGDVFETVLGPMPENITAPCCGQFAVTRSRILAHPRSFYQASIHWLQRTELESFLAGLIYEYAWSYIFGTGVKYLPPPECETYHCLGDETELSREVFMDKRDGLCACSSPISANRRMTQH